MQDELRVARRPGNAPAQLRLGRVLVAMTMSGVLLAAGCRAVRFAAEDDGPPHQERVSMSRQVSTGDPGAQPAGPPASAPTTAAPPASAPAPDEPTTTTAAPPAPAASAADTKVFVLGDSVLKGARHALPATLGPGSVVDAVGSRRIDAGVARLRERQSEMGPVVVAQLGNNYLGDEQAFAASLDELHQVVGPDRWLVLLRVYPIQENRAEVNGALDALAAKHANVRVVDWPAAMDAHVGATYDDHLHLTPQGAELMATVVGDAVASVAGTTPPSA